MEEPLLGEMIAFFERWLAENQAGFDQLRPLVAQMRSLGGRQTRQGPVLPVVQNWLTQAVHQPTVPHCSVVLSALAKAMDQLRWLPLTADYIGEQFAAGFAYTQVIGPPVDGENVSLFASDTIAAGFSLQAPALFYPPHYHKAIEFYGVLTGTARWQAGSEPPVWQAPGTTIFHESEVAHAMETAVEPLLTIWAWMGDLESPPIIPAWEWL